MDAHPSHLTPQQAREQLTAAQSRSLSSRRDRTIHAVGMVFVGVVIGVHMALRNVIGEGAYALVGLLVIGVLFLEMIWVDRTARTVPRRVRLCSWAGFIISFLVGLWVVTPWLNLAAQSGPNTWPMVLVGAVATAAPSLVAAVVIAAGRR